MWCLQTVLLGDAAHTMSPALAQGLNAGLEDVTVFAQCLEQYHGNVDAALPAYNKARLPDIQAILTINEVVASSDIGLTIQVQFACPSVLHDLAHPLPTCLIACLCLFALVRWRYSTGLTCMQTSADK